MLRDDLEDNASVRFGGTGADRKGAPIPHLAGLRPIAILMLEECGERNVRQSLTEVLMGEVVDFDDGFGWRVGTPYPMPARPGSHSAYARGSDLVVEWYDFGPHAPYESANLLVFGREAQLRFAEEIGVDPALTPHELACEVALKFESYFDVKSFARERTIPFTSEVDFQP